MYGYLNTWDNYCLTQQDRISFLETYEPEPEEEEEEDSDW